MNPTVSTLCYAVGKGSSKKTASRERGCVAYKPNPAGVLLFASDGELVAFRAMDHAYPVGGMGTQKHRPLELNATGELFFFVIRERRSGSYSRFLVPYTRALESTTASSSSGLPILQVELAW